MPEIYWYLFWVGVVLIVTAVFISGGIIAHRHRMEMLKILRSYADKGVEPPPALADELARQIFAPPVHANAQPQGRGALLRGFLGASFTACVAWGLNQWIVELGRTGWPVHASWAAFAFFAVAAFGLLLAAVTTRDK